MAWLVKMLENAEPPIDAKKFIAVSAYNLGLSARKIREYLEVLQDMESLEIDWDNKVLTWRK